MRMMGASALIAFSVDIFGQLETEIDIFADLFLDDVGGLVGRAVILNESFANLLRARADEFNLALQQKTQAIDRVDV